LAKAQFYRHQRVWVEAVGAWATIERLVPVWTKGFDEPVRITYDVGLGREFAASELQADTPSKTAMDESGGAWRVLRARNKWQEPEDCGHHPYPGTFPIVVTDKENWGGWRVPGAEYDRAPYKIEQQSRLISAAPKLLKLAEDLAALASEDLPSEALRLARAAKNILSYVADPEASSSPEDSARKPAVQARRA
jgi:hypothetical protein